MYKDQDVSYLVDVNDSVRAYEERGKESCTRQSQYDQGMEALTTMDRTQQVEVLHGTITTYTHAHRYIHPDTDTYIHMDRTQQVEVLHGTFTTYTHARTEIHTNRHINMDLRHQVEVLHGTSTTYARAHTQIIHTHTQIYIQTHYIQTHKHAHTHTQNYSCYAILYL
jgi:hypothetical protein